MQVTIHAAKTNLSKLIQVALAGEEVITVNGSKPVVKLLPLPGGRYQLSGLEGKLAPPPDEFFAPLGEDELAEWE